MVDTNTQTNSEPQKWPVWLVASLGFITIICGIVTICAPSIFWKFLDIILGIFLIFSGISAIIKCFKDKDKYMGCLITLASLIILLGFMLVFSGSEFVGTLTIWAFAVWALLRGFVLIYFSITNKEQQKFRWGIMTLGILLIVLSIIIACSDKSDARSLAGICIGISSVFDGIFLLILSFRVNEDPSLQSKILEQANQNEISQGTVVTPDAQPVVATPDAQPVVATPDAQPAVATPDAQPVVSSPDTQPVVATPDAQPAVAAPDAQPAVAAPDAQPVVSTPDTQPAVATPDTQPAQVNEPTPTVESNSVKENKTVEETQTPTEENKPTE